MATSKTLFFDLGNVLMFFSFPRMCEQLGKVLNLPALTVQKEIMEHGLGANYEKGKITSHVFYEHLCKLSGTTPPYEDVLKAACDIFNPNRDILPLLSTLKRKGHRLFVLSNTCEGHFSYTKKHYPEMLHHFEGFVLSYEVGAMKPEEKIFRAALEKAGADPAHSFYTDDIPDFIAAAARVDIPGMVFVGVDPLIETLKLRGFL